MPKQLLMNNSVLFAQFSNYTDVSILRILLTTREGGGKEETRERGGEGWRTGKQIKYINNYKEKGRKT